MASSTSVALVFMFAWMHASEINSRILGDIFNIIYFYDIWYFHTQTIISLKKFICKKYSLKLSDMDFKYCEYTLIYQ